MQEKLVWSGHKQKTVYLIFLSSKECKQVSLGKVRLTELIKHMFILYN